MDDYEAMEQGSDAESEGWGQDEEEEEEEPAAEQDESSDEEQDQDDGTDHGNEEDSDEGIDEAGDEGLPEDLSEERTARRRTVKLGALSDEDEDEDAGQGEVTARGRHTASGRGEAASFLEMEAEMSGDEGHDGEEDDDDDAEDGMLKDLIGTAKEGARDEAIRAKMHAEWEAQKDAEELKLAMLAKHHGYRRVRLFFFHRFCFQRVPLQHGLREGFCGACRGSWTLKRKTKTVRLGGDVRLQRTMMTARRTASWLMSLTSCMTKKTSWRSCPTTWMALTVRCSKT